MQTIRKEISIRSDIASVWRAWTEPDMLTKWAAPGAEVDPRTGGKYEWYFDLANKDSMSTKGCRITVFEEPRELAFDWKGPDQYAAFMNVPDRLTVVRVLLEPQGEGVRVALEHAGWGDTDEWQQALQWHSAAWDQLLTALEQTLTRA